MTLPAWMFWSLIGSYLAFVGLILYLDARRGRIIRSLRLGPKNDNQDWRTSMQVDLKQVLEILERHLDANGERRLQYKALRRFRKELIEELAEVSEETWDKMQNPK